MRKLAAILLLFTVSCIGCVLSAETPDPWSQKVDISVDETPLRRVIDLLTHGIGVQCNFAGYPYAPEDYSVTLHMSNARVEDVLAKVLNAAGLSYTKDNNRILIFSDSNETAPAREASNQSDGPEAVVHARAGDLTLALKLYTKDGAISAREPLIAKLTILNKSKHTVSVSRGVSDFSIRVTVFDKSGNALAETPQPRTRASNMSFPMRLAPGASHSRILIISALYSFERPSNYTVRVQQLESAASGKSIAECAANVRVLPYDAKRLHATLDKLVGPVRGAWTPTNRVEAHLWSNAVRRKALLSVQDEIAVPYIQKCRIISSNEAAARIMARRNGPIERPDWVYPLEPRMQKPPTQSDREERDLMWAMNEASL